MSKDSDPLFIEQMRRQQQPHIEAASNRTPANRQIKHVDLTRYHGMYFNDVYMLMFGDITDKINELVDRFNQS